MNCPVGVGGETRVSIYVFLSLEELLTNRKHFFGAQNNCPYLCGNNPVKSCLQEFCNGAFDTCIDCSNAK